MISWTSVCRLRQEVCPPYFKILGPKQELNPYSMKSYFHKTESTSDGLPTGSINVVVDDLADNLLRESQFFRVSEPYEQPRLKSNLILQVMSVTVVIRSVLVQALGIGKPNRHKGETQIQRLFPAIEAKLHHA